jgi:hypothetical protein
MSKVVLWFGSIFPHCKIITTAPTWQLVEMQLWSEIRQGYSAARYSLGGRMLQTQWKLDHDWFAIGLSPKEDAGEGEGQGASSSFQGFHAPRMLIVFDEATGVPPKRWMQAHGMTTSAEVMWVVIGNPTTKNCDFARCFNSRIWAKVHLSCFDSPNLKANGITDLKTLARELDVLRELDEDAARKRILCYKTVHPALLTLQWVMDRALTWGLDHPLFQSKALGNFPEDDANALFSSAAVEAAQARKYRPTLKDRFSIGVDVARFGNDRTVLTPIAGRQVEAPKVIVKRDTSFTTGEVIVMVRDAIKRGFNPKRMSVVIDGTGVGSGVVDACRQAQREGHIHHDVEVREVHFGQGFSHIQEEEDQNYAKEHYANMKAKLFVECAEAVKKPNGGLCLPSNEEYGIELPSIPYFLDSKGRFVIMSKEEYTQETGLPSPDFSDSLVLALYGLAEMSGEVGVMRVIRG